MSYLAAEKANFRKSELGLSKRCGCTEMGNMVGRLTYQKPQYDLKTLLNSAWPKIWHIVAFHSSIFSAHITVLLLLFFLRKDRRHTIPKFCQLLSKTTVTTTRKPLRQ